MIGLVQTFVGEWLSAGVAIVALVAAAVAYFRLPIFGKETALVLVALAVGLLAWRAGYTTRAAQDQSAALRARIETMQADITTANRAAADARDRAATLEAHAAEDQDRISAYAQHLADQDRLPVPVPEPALAPSIGAPPVAPARGVCSLTSDDVRMILPPTRPARR